MLLRSFCQLRVNLIAVSSLADALGYQDKSTDLYALACVFLQMLGFDVKEMQPEQPLQDCGELEGFKRLALSIISGHECAPQSAQQLHLVLQQLLRDATEGHIDCGPK